MKLLEVCTFKPISIGTSVFQFIGQYTRVLISDLCHDYFLKICIRIINTEYNINTQIIIE